MEYKELEGERVLLVTPDHAYAKDILQYLDMKTTRYMFPKAQDNIEECHSFIEFSLDAIHRKIEYNYIILEKNTREFLGCCGIASLNEKEPEFGIWIKQEAHHHGYGKEALHVLYAYAKDMDDFDGFVYPVDHRNSTSRRIPESLGGVCDNIIKKHKNKNGDTLELVTYHISK